MSIEKVVDRFPPTIFCTDIISFKEGEDVIVECSAFTSTVKIQPGQLIVQWRRVSNFYSLLLQF